MEARLDDGMLELLEMRRGPRLALLGLLLKIFDGSHVGSPLVDLESVPRLDLELTPGSDLNVDGETLTATQVQIRLAPGALRILAPSN